MPGPDVTAIEALLQRMRLATGGSMAALLSADREVLALDGDATREAWSALLAQVDVRWDRWRDLESDDVFTTENAPALAYWLDEHGVLLVEVGRTNTIGLARVRVAGLVRALRALIDRDDDPGPTLH